MGVRGYLYIGAGILVVAGIITALVYLVFSPAQNVEVPEISLGTGDPRTTVTPTTPGGTTGVGENIPIALPTATQPVFKISNGPVVSATIIQTLRPTTTVARYIQQQNGHVFDVVLDSSGAVPKSVSNTTIPGIVRALWAKKGNAVVVQYVDENVKTAALLFPTGATPTSTLPVIVRFFPDNILDMAISPDGEKIAYLLATTNGVRGYTANIDSTNSAELFTLQLSEVLVQWPSQNTLLLQTKSASGVPGMAFSVTISNGAVVSLLHASGLTVTADPTFSYLVYKSGAGDTVVRQLRSGLGTTLSYNPYPEKCVWGSGTTTMYCSTPNEYTGSDYLGLWHLGTIGIDEAILKYDITTGTGSILAVPGAEGGEPSAIDALTASEDGKYVLFVKRGIRSLWGVRP